MLCPFCMEIQEPAPSIFGEGEPCSTPHCFKPSCCSECTECYDWFRAIEPEEGEVVHPKAARPSTREGQVPGIEGTAPGPVIPDGTIPSPPVNKWTVLLTDEQMKKSREKVARWEANKKKHGTLNPYMVDPNNPNPVESNGAIGAFGETALGGIFGLSVDKSLMKYGDGGTDFVIRGKILDVKTARKPVFLIAKTYLVPKAKTDIYILARFTEPNRIDFLGWATKAEMLLAEIRDFGYGKNHAILQDKIHGMDELKFEDADTFEKYQKLKPKPAQEDIPW